MKQLLILRHAKSSWSHPNLDDHDRPLKPRGLRDGPRVGRLLREEKLVPDRIISSTAIRARETALAVASSCGYLGDVCLTSDLYLAASRVYMERIAMTTRDVQRLMFVGHNPGMEQLVTLLTGADEDMPTAALALVEIDAEEWRDVQPGSGRLVSLWKPRELHAEDG